MRNANGDYIGTYDNRVAPIGAGGFVIGMDISADGQRMIHWADVFNGYIRNAGEKAWQLLLRGDNMDAAEFDPRPATGVNDQGVFAGRIAPSNKDIIYVAWNGFIFKTTNGGASFTRTAFGPKEMESNMGPQRRFNRTIDVHPTNPNHVIVGTNGDGCHYTTDGGATWTDLGLPATTNTYHNSAGKYLVAIDPSNPNNVYVHVYGVNLYRSTTGVAGPFSVVSGGPTSISSLVISPSGILYLCQFRNDKVVPEISTGPLYKWTAAGGFVAILTGKQTDQVAVNPLNEQHLVAVDENSSVGLWNTSLDGGQTWTSAPNEYRGSGETGWFSNRQKSMYPAQLMFDPVVNGRLWVTEGLGISYCDLPAPGQQMIFHDYSAGNEELVAFSGASFVGIPEPFFTCWDKPIWKMKDLRKSRNDWAYPGTNGNVVTIGHWIDQAIDDPNFLVATVGQNSAVNGYSTNKGETWLPFAGAPSYGWNPGGCIAVSNKNNIIVTCSNNGGAFWTKDGGATWDNVSFGGYSPVTNWANAYYVHRRNIVADKTRPGVFCCFLSTSHPLGAGVWLTTDGGENWTQKKVGTIQTGRQQFWQADFRYVPERSGELMFADCEGNSASRIMWSQDDGATWTQMPHLTGIRRWDFGKAKPGQTRPAIFARATYNGVEGYYVSYDWLATPPTLLTRFPRGSFNGANAVCGDMNKFGRFYVGLGANGWAVIEYAKRFALA